MKLVIDPASHTPIYQQIVRQITTRVATGSQEPGQRLPSVRRLAEELVVNPNTVARAYRELEREGVVVSRPGDGVFVADHRSPFRAGQRRRLLEDAVSRLLSETSQLGVGLEEVIAALRERAATSGEGGAAAEPAEGSGA